MRVQRDTDDRTKAAEGRAPALLGSSSAHRRTRPDLPGDGVRGLRDVGADR